MFATTESVAKEWLDSFWNLNVMATSCPLSNYVTTTLAWEFIRKDHITTNVWVWRSVENCRTAVCADMSKMIVVFTTKATLTTILACCHVPSWLWKNLLLASLAKNSLNMLFGSHDLNIGVGSLHLIRHWHWGHHLRLLLWHS